jgi:hypothetical protein
MSLVPVLSLKNEIPSCGTVFYRRSPDADLEEIPFAIKKVKMLKTDEEKRRERRVYRRQYARTPKALEAAKKRASNPADVQRRKEYAQRPDVKERKKLNAQRARVLKKLIKVLLFCAAKSLSC